MAGEDAHAAADPTMFFISLVVGATAIVLIWLMWRVKGQGGDTRSKSGQKKKQQQPQQQQQSDGKLSGGGGKGSKKKQQQQQQQQQRKGAAVQFTHPELLTSLKGHTGTLTSGGFSSNGKHFISAADVCCRGRRFDPGGSEAAACDGSEEDSGSGGGVEDLDSSSVSSSSQLVASNTPSDTEEAGAGGAKMSRRQRKNKNKGKARARAKGGEGASSSSSSNSVSSLAVVGSTQRLFERLGKTMEQVHALLLPLCCSHEVSVLNGYPFSSSGGGVHVFRPTGGLTSLAAVLGGAAHHPTMLEDEPSLPRPSLDEEEATSDYSEPEESLLDPGRTDCCTDDNDQDTSSGISSDSKEGEGEGAGMEPLERVERCKRCRQHFTLGSNGARPCQHHPHKISMLPDASLRYLCCNKLKGVAGCTSTPMHVYHNLQAGLNGPLEGYVATRPGPPAVVALDCEMVFTSEGFELARVSAVDVSGAVLLDEYVQPRGRVYDYNTQFSGITAQHLAGALGFSEARERLLAVVTADTVLVGHSMEGDLAALRMVHGRMVDTAVLFKGPQHHLHHHAMPVKQSLKALAKRHLARDIQVDPAGHDSLEDAAAVLDLVLNHFIESRKVSKVAPLPPALRNM